MLCPITQVTKETSDTVTIRVAVDENFTFLPGQFMMITAAPQGQPVKRAFSIASSPARKGYLEFCVKQTPDGLVSPYLQTVTAGMQLELAGPYGRFTFVEGTTDHVVLIGAGSGIVPLRAIAQYIDDKQLPLAVDVFYSNKKTENIIYHQEWKEWINTNERHRLFLTITQEDDQWAGRRGRFDGPYLQQAIGDLQKPLYYLCGPLEFVRAMKEALLAGGARKEWVKTEIYE